MNGRVSKRIRHAARIISAAADYHKTVARLKQEYQQQPYHKRSTPVVESHSEVLRKRYR